MRYRAGIVLTLFGCLGYRAPEAVAQPSPTEAGRWEVEVHGGGVVIGQPTGATTALPPAGEVFTAGNGRPSRYLSSVYFGESAAFLNEHAAAFTNLPRSGRIVPLDTVLTGASARSSDTGSVGVRVGRRLTSRVTAEINVDYGRSVIQLSEAAQRDIEATRVSFEAVFRDLFRSENPLQFQNTVVRSVSAMDQARGGQVVATGALRVKLRSHGPLVPYVTGGLGAIFMTGQGPTVTLSGTYSFLWTAGEPFSEGDTVTVRWVRPDRSVVGLLGAGFTHDLSGRHGIRGDVRVHVRPHAIDTVVSATPATQVLTPPRAFASATTPSVQYSNNPVGTGVRSTLSGAPVSGFTTREASGWQVDTAVGVGYFWRF